MRRVLLLFLIVSYPLCSEEVVAPEPLEEVGNLISRVQKPKSPSELVNSWIPYWMHLRQPKNSPFFQANVGIGFLYFSGVKGNFSTVPGNIANLTGANTPVEGRLSYNRTPLFEYLLGYRLNMWFKMAMSYEQQSGVTVQTKPRRGVSYNTGAVIPGRQIVSIFKANLNLNALLAKFYFEYPVPMIWKNLGYNPYIGLGFGPSWQSWTNLQLTEIQIASMSSNATIVEQSVKQKISSNFMWMFDLGVRVRSPSEERNFFLVAGIKYNQWGQAKNLGELSQQGSSKIGFVKPFAIKTIYSFSPYLGAQFNFPNTMAAKSPLRIEGHNLKSWKMFFVSPESLGEIKTVYVESNVGIGFLYFSGVRGALSSRPRDPLNNLPSLVPYARGGIQYNRTPLYEFLTGFRLKPYLRAAFSYQHQSDVEVSTDVQNYEQVSANLNNSRTYAQFKGNLILDSVLAKVYAELPSPLVWRSIAMTPYLALAVGPGWQTWTQMNVWRYTNAGPIGGIAYTSAAQPLRDKISANVVWTTDAGLRLKSVHPGIKFSVVLGCKYNQWGQARNLGKIAQQQYRSYGLFPPMRIKTIYSFAPYVGASWDYPIYNKLSTKVQVQGRSPNTWMPYIANLNEVQEKQAVWLEYSLGVGFLYFHDVKGQLAQVPSADGAGFSGIPPVGRKLSYNRTPLYEFMIGYRYLQWLRFCVSYQTQRNVSIFTQFYTSAAGSATNNATQFTANLQLDSFMAKGYVETPIALIMKNLASTLYLGIGLGPSWQSWTQIEYRLASLGGRNAQYYSEKICANVALMVDAGFRVQSVFSCGAFSITKGVKYMQWGQARNLGKLSQQGSLKTGLFKPIGIRVIYSFSPYLGVQWNY